MPQSKENVRCSIVTDFNDHVRSEGDLKGEDTFLEIDCFPVHTGPQ
jgi:hypothetical protein